MSTKIKLLRTAEEGEKLAPQAKIFYDHMIAVGVGKELLRSDLVAKVEAEGKLETRQPIDRVLGYYLQHFKKIGLAEVIRAPKAPAAPKAEKPAKSNAAASPTEAETKPEKAA